MMNRGPRILCANGCDYEPRPEPRSLHSNIDFRLPFDFLLLIFSIYACPSPRGPRLY